MHATAAEPPAADSQGIAPRVFFVKNDSRAQYELQARLIEAVPGDVIEFGEGIYRFHRQIDIFASHLTLRGQGSDKTTLSFRGQSAGSHGLEAVGDAIRIEGLAVEDTTGNAIKILGANGVTLRDVRVEWTEGEKSSNGAYGLYPVQCQNVLIDQCTAIGASDAGIYVGQCHDVIVRRCRAERNVAGIEIENTVRADVYDNVATNNAGGVLVFDLPGLQVKRGRHVRVFRNRIESNNHVNFAAPGNIVASVPSGTGLMVMASDEVEVFDNDILDHRTSGISVVSFLISGKKLKDPDYDPYPEAVQVHHNRISKSGYRPAGQIGLLLKPVLGATFPDMLYDGMVDRSKMKEGKLPAELRNLFVDNGEATFANFHFADLSVKNIATGRYQVDRDLRNYHASIRPLAKVEPTDPPPASKTLAAAIIAYRNAPDRLSDWNLFEEPLAKQQPSRGVYRYELNTPLYSDDANKHRFVRLPKGRSARFKQHGVFDFPDDTVIVKTFSYPNDSFPTGERLMETRIETKIHGDWIGYTYIWNDDQSDATLALGGGEAEVAWVDQNGIERHNRYQIPNANQCLNCHQQNEKFVPLGPIAANLNRPHKLEDGSVTNQLDHWRAVGLLDRLPPRDHIDQFPVFDDASSGTVNDRARAWLHVNCAHCHSPLGTARTSGLDLRISQQDPTKFGVWKTPVAAGHGSGGREYDIVPGKPDDSILLFRIEATDPSIAMPNVGRNLVPTAAAKLIREWIASMPEETDQK